MWVDRPWWYRNSPCMPIRAAGGALRSRMLPCQTWRARWWTQGDEPGTTGPDGVWLDLGACSGQPSPTPTPPIYPPPGWPDRVFAPYVDLLLYPTTSVTGVRTETGQAYFTLAFITSGGGCTPESCGRQGMPSTSSTAGFTGTTS